MVHRTISVPLDVVPIIEGLDQPFSQWVTARLREHAARSDLTFEQELRKDAELAKSSRPTAGEMRDAGRRMQRSAPW